MEQLKFATKKFDVLKNNLYNTIKSSGGGPSGGMSGGGVPQGKPQASNTNSNATSNYTTTNSSSSEIRKSAKGSNKPQQQQISTTRQHSTKPTDSLYEVDSDEDYYGTETKANYNQISNEYIYSNNNQSHSKYYNEDLDDLNYYSTNNNNSSKNKNMYNSNNNRNLTNENDNYQFTVKHKKSPATANRNSKVNNNNVNNNSNNTNNNIKKKEKNPYSFNEFNKSNNLDNDINVNNVDNSPILNYYDPDSYKNNHEESEEFSEETLMDEFEDFVQIRDNNINPICVQYYIPFYQTPEMCKNETRKWLEERWFLPATMNNNGSKENIKWSKQNRFYFPVYVFSVVTTTLFNATFTINDVPNTVSNQKISSVYEEIIFAASNSIDSTLVDQLLTESAFSNRSTHKLPSNDELQSYSAGKPIVGVNGAVVAEKMLAIDMGRDDVWQNSVHPFLMKEERKKCTKFIKEQYYVKTMDLQMRDPIIESERYFIVFLPISAETYQYGESNFDTLTSGSKGKTVGQRPIGTGVIGKMIIDVASKVSNLVNDSI